MPANIICSEMRTGLREQSLRETVSFEDQIYEHAFVTNGGYCVYYPSYIFKKGKMIRNY